MNLMKRIYQAVLAGEGPKTIKEAAILMLKGSSMGAADIIPGVSGGTLAFITGIYPALVAAIAAVDGKFFKRVFSLRLIEALERLHTRFLIPLFFGIIVTVVLLASPMHFLLTYYKTYTWSLFFGLILFSIFIVGREIEDLKNVKTIISILIGLIVAFFLVGAIPVMTPENYLFIFFSGAIGAIAMILPGISGSFILLLLGKYHFITGALKNPLIDNHLAVLFIFCLGMATGLVSFSKILKYLFAHYSEWIYGLLTGFMIGAMRKIWPWKDVISEQMINGKNYVLEESNKIPTELNYEVMICILLMVLGVFVVFSIDRIAQKKN